MFARIRAVNGWFIGSTVSGLEFEAIDAMRPSAIDGDDGGTYAPSALLSIGGLAVTLNPATLTLSAAAMAVSAPGTWTAAQSFGTAAHITAQGNVTLSGTSAALRFRAPLTLTSGPASETVYFYNDLILTPALQSADILAEADKVSALAGARIRLVRTTPMVARKTELANGVGGSVIGTIPTGEIGWIESQFVSGNWIVIGWGGGATVP
jgi:hypothetical protein